MNKQKCNRKQKHWSSVLAFIGVIGGLALVADDGFIPVANAQDELVYVPLDSPCRVVNTQSSGTAKLVASDSRDFLSYGSSGPIGTQGGDSAGCDHPRSAEGIQPAAIAANITAVGKQASGNGNIVAYAAGSAAPSASTVNYTTAANIANSTIITLRTSDGSFTLLSNRSDVPAVVDVVGYFYPMAGGEQLVNCSADAGALKNLTLIPNSTYILTGICDGPIMVSGAGLGTINIEGDGAGVKDDGITLPPGETDGDSVFAAIYANNGVKLNLNNLVINAANYNAEADLYISGIGAYWGANVSLTSVDIVGGDQGIGVYNSGMLKIFEDVSVTGFRDGGIVAGRTSVIRVYDPVTVTGGSSQEGSNSEAIAAVDSGVVSVNDGGTITPASGPGLSSDLDTAAAISAFRNGVITVRDVTLNGSVWSGESSTVDLRNVTQSGGNIDAYRNSVIRVRSSSVTGVSADDVFAGVFSTIRMDNTNIGNASGTGSVDVYSYGVIDLRGTTDMNGRDFNCSDPRSVRIRPEVTNVGSIGC